MLRNTGWKNGNGYPEIFRFSQALENFRQYGWLPLFEK